MLWKHGSIAIEPKLEGILPRLHNYSFYKEQFRSVKGWKMKILSMVSPFLIKLNEFPTFIVQNTDGCKCWLFDGMGCKVYILSNNVL